MNPGLVLTAKHHTGSQDVDGRIMTFQVLSMVMLLTSQKPPTSSSSGQPLMALIQILNKEN
jgi:hypothetical protein